MYSFIYYQVKAVDLFSKYFILFSYIFHECTVLCFVKVVMEQTFLLSFRHPVIFCESYIQQYLICLEYLGSLGDLFPLESFGDFRPTHSSLNSISLESEQLQLSVI